MSTRPGVLRFCHGNGTAFECEITSTAVMPVGSFHHFAIVRDAVSSPKRVLFYKDGVLTDTTTYTQTVTTSTNSLIIGSTSGGTTPFDGYLDEVAVYNYQLSADRIRLHAEARLNDSISKFTVGPTLCGNVRTGTRAFDVAERWCLGNLAGTYGYASPTAVYGFASGNPSATWISADATNGFRVMNGSTTKLQFDTSGNGFLDGSLTVRNNITVGTAGAIMSGATAYDTGTGYWLDHNAGSPRFRIGETSAGDQYLRFTGSALELSTPTLRIGDAGIALNGGTAATWDTQRAYRFDYGDGREVGLGSFGTSVRQLDLRVSKAGETVLTLLSETTTGNDSNITLNSQGSIPARITIGTTDLFINGSQGFSGTKVAGSCTFTFVDGFVTNVTGC